MANILIIEDDPDIAAIERDYLSLAGHSITIEPDGNAGLRAALDNEFDLLLLDLMLPGVDGFTICKQVREQKKASHSDGLGQNRRRRQDSRTRLRRGRLY